MKCLMLLQLTEGPPLPHRSVLVVAIPHVSCRKLRLHHRVNFVGSDFGLKMSFEPDKICDSDYIPCDHAMLQSSISMFCIL